MARNQEKAQAMLNRFLEAKRTGFSGGKGSSRVKRKIAVNEVVSISEAETERTRLLGKIGHCIEEIQNSNLGENEIRELNDRINQLLDEKKEYEMKITLLGGRDHIKASSSGNITDIDGKSIRVPGSTYMYFGAARSLPGISELLSTQHSMKRSKKTKKPLLDLHANANAYYYGFEDEYNNESLVNDEYEQQCILYNELMEAAGSMVVDGEDESDEEVECIPTDQEIRDSILAYKKKQLLRQFVDN